jgi:hypothetical protein
MKHLWPYLRPIVYLAWLVAAVRLAIDATLKPAIFAAPSMVSVFYALPLLMIWTGIRGAWDSLPFPKMLAGFALLGLLCFGLPNFVSYTTAQFAGWTHGRFRPPAPGKEGFGEDKEARAAPIKETAAGKVGAGATIGFFTTISGFVWCTVTGALFIYIPARVRRKKTRQPVSRGR